MNRAKMKIWLAAMIMTFCGVASAQVDAQISITFWKAELDTTGDWFDDDLWTAGVPTAEAHTWFVNGSETMLDAGEAQAFSLWLNRPRLGGSQLTQTGGRLDVEKFVAIDDGIYRSLGGRLVAEELSLNASAINGNPSSIFVDLSDVPQPASCHLQAIAPGDSSACFLSAIVPDARFLLDGGEVEFTESVTVGQAQLQIFSGRLEAGQMLVDSFGVGSTTSQVNQEGGVVNVDGELKIQDGTYTLSGGELTTQRLAMGDPAGDPPFTLFLPTRSPEFVQTGGSVRVLENLDLCIPGFILPGTIAPTFTDVTYRLEAGSLTVGGDTVVGSLGVAPAQFIQSGGTQRTNGTLRIEGGRSIYDMQGGELQVDALAVGTGVFNEGGTFAIAAGAEVVVNSRITLGTLAVVEAMPGSRIRLDGGDVEILGTNPSLLDDLRNVSLFFTGDESWSTLEAASDDLGSQSEGFDNNFAWAELILGAGADTSRLKLVDLFDNRPNGGTEAVYVDRLVVGPNSTLDLGGLNLYYRKADIAGQIILSGGSLLVAVPEPSTAQLLLLFSVAAFGVFRASGHSPHGETRWYYFCSCSSSINAKPKKPAV